MQVPKMGSVSVVVPVFNEKATLSSIIEKLSSCPVVKEIIVVDDASTDGSGQLLEELQRRFGLKLFSHVSNRGKGAALRTGFQAATAELVAVQDADLEYNPRDLPRLVQPLLEGETDAAYGSRLLGGDMGKQPLGAYLANRFLTLLSNILTGYHLTDMETCYKMFRREVLEQLELAEDRFGFEPEVTLELARAGFRIREVPVSYAPRARSAGKKISIKDALRTLWVLIARKLAPPASDA